MIKRFGIKFRLMAGVVTLTTIIIVGLTFLSYQQHRIFQNEKVLTQASTIITPFYDLLRQELPASSENLELYLKVALHARQDTQLPELIRNYQQLEAIRFIDVEGSVLASYGRIDDVSYSQLPFLSEGQVRIQLPFEKSGRLLGSSVLFFSLVEFYREETQILLNGLVFLVIFLIIGLVGAQWMGHSIAGPIQLLADHIRTRQLEDLPLIESEDEVGEFSRTIHDMAVKLNQRESDLKYMAYFDMLTGLPNRTYFIDRFNQMLHRADRENTSSVLLFIDLNGFKFVNDTYSHSSGDELLGQVGRRMEQGKRESDILARISGDEFTLALHNPGSRYEIAEYCEGLLEKYDKPFMLEGHQVYISASIGIARYPDDGNAPDILINRADQAMYRAKSFGGNQYSFYEDKLHKRNLERLALELDLRNAIETGDLDVHYQPKVFLEDSQLSGIEALVRWHHPQHGNIPPDKFIPLAEATGLIRPLGQMVLYKACKQMNEWLDQGLPDIRMAVNLSPLQFTDPKLLDNLKSVLSRTGLNASNLGIEITESVAMRQLDRGVRLVNEIHDMGIEIAMDDFGTGYSSLSHLRYFKLSILKIDKSFVLDLVGNEDNISIVKAIISMAQALGLKTVAEGVEDLKQAEILLSMGSQQAQGYYYSRPLSAQAFAEYVGIGKAAPSSSTSTCTASI